MAKTSVAQTTAVEKPPTGGDGFPRRPPRVPKAWEVLAENLRRRILGQNLTPGTRLPSEAELIQEFGFSRGTVREALRLLEAEGLITTKRGPGGGIIVSRPDPDHVTRSFALLLSTSDATLRDLFAFRKMLEPGAAEVAALRATPEQRELILRCAESDDRRPFPGQVEFHVLIADATHNAVLRLVLRTIEDVVRWHAADEHLSGSDRDGTGRAHNRIARAIAKGDGPGAARAMLTHLERFEAAMDAKGRLDQPVIPRSHW